MFRRAFITGSVVLTLVGTLTSPRRAEAQAGRPHPHPQVKKQTPVPHQHPQTWGGHTPHHGGVDPHHTPHHGGHPDPMHHGDWHTGRDGHHGRDLHNNHHHEDGRHHSGTSWAGGFESAAFGSFVNPYLTGAVGGGWPGAMPYMAGGNPYTPGYEGGGTGYGGSMPLDTSIPATADLLRAYSQALKTDEETRQLREQTELMRLMTAKKKAEVRAYIDSITPTWSQREAKIAKGVLAHSLVTSSASEIASAAPLNVLLDELRKSMGRRISSSQLPLSEGILGRINVAARKSTGMLGLLRQDGSFAWPGALNGIVSKEQRAEIDSRLQTAVQEVSTGAASRKPMPELRRFATETLDKLARRVNEISGSPYLEAKHFLEGLQSACTALENGDAVPYIAYQKWLSGGKTVAEVVDYMLQHGLRFAPAQAGDEHAYRALHTALSAYHLTTNPQAAAVVASAEAGPEP